MTRPSFDSESHHVDRSSPSSRSARRRDRKTHSSHRSSASTIPARSAVWNIEEDTPIGGTAPAWIVTFSDMMSLLLTFFILLVATSEVRKPRQLREMLERLEDRFPQAQGHPVTKQSPMPHSASIPELPPEKETAPVASNTVGESPSTAADLDSTAVRALSEGVLIQLGGPCVFDEGSAQISPALKADLMWLAGYLNRVPGRVIVRGHAMRERPASLLGSQASGMERLDPLDLSWMRADRAASILERFGVPRNRLEIVAAGDTQPRYVSRLPERQRQNRRVDVFLPDAYTTPPEPRPQIPNTKYQKPNTN